MNHWNRPLLASTVFSAIGHVFVLSLHWTPNDFGKNTHHLDYPVRTLDIRLASLPSAAPGELPPRRDFVPPTAAPPQMVRDNSSIDAQTTHKAESVDYYFSARELDERVVPHGLPDFESHLADPQTHGKATITFWVEADGTVGRMEISDSSLPETLVSLLHTHREELHFTPGRKNGIPVKSVVRFELSIASEIGAKTRDRSGQFAR